MILLFPVGSLLGNDGVFYAQGDTLFPVKETDIVMSKEALKLTRDGGDMKVEVIFEFLNQGKEKTQKVGFVTPPATGDVTDEWKHPQVSDFTVKVNDKALEYEVTSLPKSGFKLGEEKAEGSDYVYHFDVTFPAGKTQVAHTYRYRGGSSVISKHDFWYRLTTGATWKGGKIGDFTMVVDMGEDVTFALPWSFQSDGKKAEWELVGEGVMADYRQEFDEVGIRMVRMKKGVVQLKAKDFTPESDLGISIFIEPIEVGLWAKPGVKNELIDAMMHLPGIHQPEHSNFTKLSDAHLRWLRNLPYARGGHVFKSKDLTDFYSKYFWYQPVKDKKVVLSDAEMEYIGWIKKEEARRADAK